MKYFLGLITGIVICNWSSVYCTIVQVVNYFMKK